MRDQGNILTWYWKTERWKKFSIKVDIVNEHMFFVLIMISWRKLLIISNWSSIWKYCSSQYRYQTIANGTLRINSVQEGDEGSYQCVVRNDGDSAQATGSLLLGGKHSS